MSLQNKKMPNSDWMKYAGLASQFFITIAVMLFIGWKIDSYFSIKTPFLIWLLPLLSIVAILIKMIKETNKPSK